MERSIFVQAVNAGGRILGHWATPGLQDEDLLETARRQTALDDFGAPPFREPLRRLLESLEAEAQLNPMGRLATRYDLIHLLVNRLRMQEDRKRNPGIAGEETPRPIVIAGLPRTGT
ncbi:MAG TPA: sulfotransferase, partial [Candidatus Methylomirabilis sp.]|nr:sulfotransferase [Candidatus Methylomirabilis sp.]